MRILLSHDVAVATGMTPSLCRDILTYRPTYLCASCQHLGDARIDTTAVLATSDERVALRHAVCGDSRILEAGSEPNLGVVDSPITIGTMTDAVRTWPAILLELGTCDLGISWTAPAETGTAWGLVDRNLAELVEAGWAYFRPDRPCAVPSPAGWTVRVHSDFDSSGPVLEGISGPAPEVGDYFLGTFFDPIPQLAAEKQVMVLITPPGTMTDPPDRPGDVRALIEQDVPLRYAEPEARLTRLDWAGEVRRLVAVIADVVEVDDPRTP